MTDSSRNAFPSADPAGRVRRAPAVAAALSFLRGRRAPGRGRLGRVARPIVRADRAVEAWLEPRRSPAADRVFYSLSSAADHGLLWLALGAARAAAGPTRPGSFRRLALTLVAESAVTNGIVKSLFRRVRPPEELAAGPLPFGMHRPITSAFPSGHAASAFTAATLLAEDGTHGAGYYTLATLVAASRVYVRMHHASDVVAGAAWGIAFGMLVRRRFPLEGR